MVGSLSEIIVAVIVTSLLLKRTEPRHVSAKEIRGGSVRLRSSISLKLKSFLCENYQPLVYTDRIQNEIIVAVRTTAR